jgi:hypothetical protein
LKRSHNEEIEILPGHLLKLSLDCKYVKKEKMHTFLPADYYLPDTSPLFNEEHFADVALGWNEEGLSVSLYSHQKFQGVDFPKFEEGDSLNLFIDTRNVKTSAFNTRFCHYFVILPKELEGVWAFEHTHFRGVEKRALADPTLIKVEAKFSKTSYQVHVVLPQEVLHGYDVLSSNHLGFTYTITRPYDVPQNFSCSAKDFKIEETPSLWASLSLVK